MKSRRVEIKFARVPFCYNEECANEWDRMKFSFVEYEFLLARARGVTCDMAYSETPSFLRTLAPFPSEEADSVFHVLSYSSWYSTRATFQKKNVRISWKSGKVIYAGLTRALAKYQGIIENLILLSLVNATSKIKGHEKQKAAQKMQNALSNLVKKE